MSEKWSDEDRQRFADRNVLKARTVPSKRAPKPEPDEWDEDWFTDEELEAPSCDLENPTECEACT